MADDSRFRHRSERSGMIGAPGAAPQSQTGDPLAELARLIGQDDVFDQMRRDAARAGEGAGAAPRNEPFQDMRASTHSELRGSLEANIAPLERRLAEPRSRQLADAPSGGDAASAPLQSYAVRSHSGRESSPRQYGTRAHDTTYGYEQAAAPQPEAYSDPYYAQAETDPAAGGAYADSSYDPAYDYGDPAYADQPEPPQRKRGGFMAVAAVLGLAAIGTAGAFGYRAMSGGDGGQPPVIKASTTPAKVAPASQGREQTARAGYDRSGERGQTERVVPREEQPIELREARAVTSRPAPSAAGASGAAVGLAGQTTGALVPPTPTPASANPSEPKKVKTIAIRPDGSIASEAASRAAAARAPAAPTRTASIPPAAASAPAAAPVSGHVVQVSSQKSENDAQASFRALQAKYPDVLGGRQPVIRRVDLGDRGIFYRVQVGPFASADQANELCSNLKAVGGQCIVQRN